MLFTHKTSIANSKDLFWYWNAYKKDFIDFPNTDVYGGKLDFTMPLDYFDIDSDTAEKLRRIGQPYDIFNNPLQIAAPALEVIILKGVNDDNGIGSLLWQFTDRGRERRVYGIYASFFFVEKSIYCAMTFCYVDKDTGCELPTAILEIGQDEGAYINPILISEDAAELFSYDDMQAVGEYLANVWFGVQYEMVNCPEEIRVVEQRGPIDLDGNYHESNGIIYVKRIIPVDENGNLIEYEARNSGRVYRKPAWNVRGHMRTLKDGREIPVRPYPKGKERKNPNAINPKQYVFDGQKLEDDSE